MVKERIIQIKEYFKQLFVPWKMITGVISIGLIVFVGRYANDPTWDDGLSLLMGLTTFLSSSFFVITFQNFKQTSIKDKIIAVLLLLVSSVWSYDYYNYFKIGIIPPSSYENIVVSVPLYIISGFFWTLDINHKYSKIIAIICMAFFSICFGFYYFTA